MTREDSGALETRPVQVGNYKFTGKILGKGTFATVEEAIHIHLKVKVIPLDRAVYIIRPFRIVLFQKSNFMQFNSFYEVVSSV